MIQSTAAMTEMSSTTGMMRAMARLAMTAMVPSLGRCDSMRCSTLKRDTQSMMVTVMEVKHMLMRMDRREKPTRLMMSVIHSWTV